MMTATPKLDVMVEAVTPSRRVLSARQHLTRALLVMLAVLTVSMLAQLALLSRLQYNASQGRAFSTLRSQLATGTAPLSGVSDAGVMLRAGTPVAQLEIPSLSISDTVLEGTSSGVLFAGPGHRRDSVLPGQVGTSVIFGRRAAYGGVFSDIDQLKPGALIVATTGQGVFHFTVMGARRAGDPQPPPVSSQSGRLELVTATGAPFVPNGVLYVDATLTDVAVGGAVPPVSSAALPVADRPLRGDTSTLWAMAMWLQALIVVAIGAVWAFQRWGRAQSWLVFTPLLLFVGLAAAGELVRLLPNLL